MKPTVLAQRLAPMIPMLRCPLCGSAFALEGASLRCQSKHCYDLSSKGYLNLAPAHSQSTGQYNTALFQSRNRIFQAGFYQPVLDAIGGMLERRFGDAPFSLADVGCGEGYYTRALSERFTNAACFGLDLSRDGIAQAARGGSSVGWLVADLKRLPFADASLDTLLDVLTPADYAEFARVLKPNGELIKVIPGEHYLCEIRGALRQHLRSAEYDNLRVLRHLEERAEVLERVVLCESYPLTERQSRDFLQMTPMTLSVPPEALNEVRLSSVTVHMELLRCRMR